MTERINGIAKLEDFKKLAEAQRRTQAEKPCFGFVTGSVTLAGMMALFEEEMRIFLPPEFRPIQGRKARLQ